MDGMKESESPRSQRVMAEITINFNQLKVMEKYLKRPENYTKRMAHKQAAQSSLQFELKLRKHVQISLYKFD